MSEKVTKRNIKPFNGDSGNIVFVGIATKARRKKSARQKSVRHKSAAT
jgi:hypothetical protein